LSTRSTLCMPLLQWGKGEEAATQYSHGAHGRADCQLPDSVIYNAVPRMWDR